MKYGRDVTKGFAVVSEKHGVAFGRVNRNDQIVLCNPGDAMCFQRYWQAKEMLKRCCRAFPGMGFNIYPVIR